MPKEWWEDETETGEETLDNDSAPDPGTPAGRRTLLAQLQAEGGDLGKMAGDMLQINLERQAKEDAEVAATLRLEARVERGETGLGSDDPNEVEQVKDDLRIQVQQRRAAADEAVLAGISKVMLAQGLDQVDVDQELARVRESQALVAEFEVGDALHDSPVYLAFERERVAKQRAHEMAVNEISNRPGELAREVSIAQAGVDAAYDELVEAGR